MFQNEQLQSVNICTRTMGSSLAHVSQACVKCSSCLFQAILNVGTCRKFFYNGNLELDEIVFEVGFIHHRPSRWWFRRIGEENGLPGSSPGNPLRFCHPADPGFQQSSGSYPCVGQSGIDSRLVWAVAPCRIHYCTRRHNFPI